MRLNLLIVDDHETTRLGIRALLGDRGGWTVCGEATNGRDAVVQVRTLSPDVVILDISMVGMNGFEVATQIRKIAPSTKIVFLSMHQVPVSAREAGGDVFVSKSSAAKDLVTAIERVTGIA